MNVYVPIDPSLGGYNVKLNLEEEAGHRKLME